MDASDLEINVQSTSMSEPAEELAERVKALEAELQTRAEAEQKLMAEQARQTKSIEGLIEWAKQVTPILSKLKRWNEMLDEGMAFPGPTPEKVRRMAP